MLFRRPTSVRLGIIAFAALVAPTAGPPPPPPAPIVEVAPPPGPEACLANVLCSLKPKVRSKKSPWSPAFCTTLAKGIVDSAARHGVSPALITAVMLNESDLDDKAVRLSQTNGRLAKDSGLMGIRCVLDDRGRCTNALVRGMTWKQVMDPLTNVELGARYLAHYREEGGREQIKIRTREPSGELQMRTKSVRCRHRNHAYWAHYNHGTRFIARGEARRYPERVAVLYKALSETFAFDGSELVADGRAVRANERVLGERPQKLCALIRQTGPVCAAPALLSAGERPTEPEAVSVSSPRSDG